MGVEAESGAALLRLPSFASYQAQAPPSSARLLVWGLAIILAGVVLFSLFLYAAVISKMLPPSGVPILDAIRADRYYYLLIPCTLPVLMVAIYFHWLSMKVFKHS